MVECERIDIEYTVRQQEGAWLWEITKSGKVLASGCSPTAELARTAANKHLPWSARVVAYQERPRS